jgi:tetratricopeptide (TPR) repeat protein
VVALSYLAWDLWFEGYLDQAVAKANAALRLADELNHTLSKTVATFFAGWLQQALHRWPEAEAMMATTLELANQAHYALWHAYGNIHHGAALVHQGRADEGLSELVQGSKAREAAGTKLGTAGHLAFVGGAYLAAGRRDAGLNTLDQADPGLETWLLAELLRVRAELLLLGSGNGAESEALLRRAIEVARSQGAKSLELRAALSLARLLGQDGRAAEGRDLVAQCYGWFTEGFDTPDLQEARELLGEVSGGG